MRRGTLQLFDGQARALNAARGVMSNAARENRNLLGTEREIFNRSMAEFSRLREIADSTEVRYRGHEIAIAGKHTPDELRSYLLTGEARAGLQADIDAQGGFLTAPAVLLKGVLEELDSLVFVRDKATVHAPIKSASAGLPYQATPIAAGAWGSEMDPAGYDTALTFGRRTLTPHPLTRGIKVSNRLIQQLGPDAATEMIVGRLAACLSVPQEMAFLVGTGAASSGTGGEPLGLFTPSPFGIPTSRDVPTGDAAAVTAAGFISALYSLPAKSLAVAEWVMSPKAMEAIATLQDENGAFLLTLRPEGDLLLGRPVNLSDFAPSELTTGTYAACVGDLSQYHICDSLQFEVQRLVQKFGTSNQTAYIARAGTDGGVANPNAFARVVIDED